MVSAGVVLLANMLDTTIKKEEKFVFPVYFDDKDFDDLEKPKEKKIEKKKEKPTKGAYNGSLKREEDIEKISKLMILSSIPNYENEMKIKKGARR